MIELRSEYPTARREIIWSGLGCWICWCSYMWCRDSAREPCDSHARMGSWMAKFGSSLTAGANILNTHITLRQLYRDCPSEEFYLQTENKERNCRTLNSVARPPAPARWRRASRPGGGVGGVALSPRALPWLFASPRRQLSTADTDVPGSPIVHHTLIKLPSSCF